MIVDDPTSKQHRKRTWLQNRSLHKYLTLLAGELNGAGYDQKLFLETVDWELPNTMESMKDSFKKIMKAMFPEVESTADLTTVELQEVYKAFDREIAKCTGVRVEWPKEKEPVESYGQYREAI